MHTTSPPPPLAANPPVFTIDVPPRFPFALMWLTIVLVATLVTFMLPEYFASTTRIKIGSDQPDIQSFSGQSPGTNALDPYFVQTEFETIQTEAILGRAIDELNLNEVWGKKYLGGGKLRTSETLVILRGRLDFRPVRNTTLLDIRALSENPNEARDLANGVAEAYRQWRFDHFLDRRRSGLQSLEKRAQLLDQQISRVRSNLAVLPETRGNTPYGEKQKQLEELTDLRSELIRRMRLEEIDLHLPRTGQVEILEAAVASSKPFRPNKPLNIILGIMFGGLAGFSLALLVYIFEHSARKRRTGGAGPDSLRGLQTFLQVTIALVVGTLVGYNCALPLARGSFFLMSLFVLTGGVAIGYVQTAKTTPLPPRSVGSV